MVWGFDIEFRQKLHLLNHSKLTTANVLNESP
jgi:hypothetical protein